MKQILFLLLSNYNFLEVLMMNKDPFIWCQIKLLTVQ